MGMTRQERISGHNKQEKVQVGKGQPSLGELTEGVPVFRIIGEALVEFVRANNILYKKILDKVISEPHDITEISDYVITWSANEPSAGSTNTIDDGATVGNDNEGGQAIADLTVKVNNILSVLRSKKIINK